MKNKKANIKILVHNKDQNKFSKITTQNDNEGIIQALLDGFKPKDEEPLEKVISHLKAYLHSNNIKIVSCKKNTEFQHEIVVEFS
ncbi:hypothetical protein [Helicobacter pylori]|uniref:hypothetical protein n=1 Tax=Helicobacter pylori TaxID=210 RepID=UPI0014954D04|nr:hypothetical protein [Helicobacter pylori]NPS34832.1 hypothetical protein [Helicobacter pylori]